MNKFSNHEVSFTGNASSRITKVGVIVSHLDSAHDALHGFMGGTFVSN